MGQWGCLCLTDHGSAAALPQILKFGFVDTGCLSRARCCATRFFWLERCNFWSRDGQSECVCYGAHTATLSRPDGLGNEADVFTKALPEARHRELCARLRDSTGALESHLARGGKGKGGGAKAAP